LLASNDAIQKEILVFLSVDQVFGFDSTFTNLKFVDGIKQEEAA